MPKLFNSSVSRYIIYKLINPLKSFFLFFFLPKSKKLNKKLYIQSTFFSSSYFLIISCPFSVQFLIGYVRPERNGDDESIV